MSLNEDEEILQQAYEACQQGNFARAYGLYEALLQTYPDDPQVLLEYGKAVYMEFEDPEKAFRLFEQAFKSDSTLVEALLWQADVAAMGYGSEQFGAMNLYRHAIELDPACVDAYIGLGLQYQAPSVALSLEEAIAAFCQAIALDPKRADAQEDLGMMLLDQGDTAGARTAFLRSIALLEESGEQKQIPAIRQYVEQIDHHETIKSRTKGMDSPRYRWFSKS